MAALSSAPAPAPAPSSSAPAPAPSSSSSSSSTSSSSSSAPQSPSSSSDDKPNVQQPGPVMINGAPLSQLIENLEKDSNKKIADMEQITANNEAKIRAAEDKLRGEE